MTTYFTSDLHLGHTGIINLCNRPFKNVEEMDEEIIARFNSVLTDEDTVYDLGDRYWKNPKLYEGRIKGKLIRIKGNHDHDMKNPVEMMTIHFPDFFDDLGFPVQITLCHYPMRSWSRSHFGTWHLFGHHHGSLAPHGLSFDVGIDCCNYYPVPLEHVAEKMKTLTPIVDFRKTNNFKKEI